MRCSIQAADHLLDIHGARQALCQEPACCSQMSLEIGEFIELIDGDFGNFIALEFDDDAHSIFVRFIAQIGDAGDCLVVDEFGDLFDQTRFVDVVGDFIDDDALPIWIVHDLQRGARRAE